jgi:ribose 5-phosphate isomerase A
MDKEVIKTMVGEYAANMIEDGSVVGLGSGSTVLAFIDKLIERCNKGLKIKAVASSKSSWDAAEAGGIDVIDINDVTHIDITVDGADEVDVKKRMVKGGGGALLREKILANASDKMVVIIDESKRVSQLGEFGLPVEVVIYGAAATKAKLAERGYNGNFRLDSDGNFFITENGNMILDVQFTSLRDEPEKDDIIIKNIPGIVDTGFFFNLADTIILGRFDGIIETLN